MKAFVGKTVGARRNWWHGRQYPSEVSSPESKFRRGNNSLAAVAASVTYIARSKAVQ